VYLQYAADLGLPGLFLFLALGIRCLRDAAAVRRSRPRDPEGQGLAKLALGIELALWAFAVAGMFHPAGYHFYFYYLGGMALAARAIQLRRTQS
jgi:O-antigen ligase